MKTTMIYTLPKWYTDTEVKETECGCIKMSDLTVDDIQGMFEASHKLDAWVVDAVWDGEIDNYDAIGLRLAFLLYLRDEDFEAYRPMSSEKQFIYDLGNEHPEIYRAYKRYENTFDKEDHHGKVD
jgi:hypothetical protein